MNPNTDDYITDEDHLFNIGTVSRMTDIPEATLRVWERRYDFPRSARTASGHRLYSQQEVLRLQWVKARIDEGMQISQSLRALQRVEEHEPLRPPPHQTENPDEITGYQYLEIYRAKLFNALLTHDANSANQILSEVFMLFTVETLVLEIVSPLLKEIGEAWCRNDIPVATEHFASHYLRHHLSLWLHTAPPPYEIEPVILACAPGELHEGGLLMLAVLLRRLRWPILYLGQNTPLEGLSRFIDEFQTPIIIFSATSKKAALNLQNWQQILSKNHHSHLIVGYGGPAFNNHPELIQQIKGIFLGESLQDALQQLNRILHELNPSLSYT